MAGRVRSVSLGGGLRVAALPPGVMDATTERLRHAVAEGGEAPVGGGTRRIADPFDVLRSRDRLDGRDAGTNALLWEAGDRFRRHWHGGALGGLTALDVSRVSVDGGMGPQATTPTEAAVRHRAVYRRASEAVGPRLLPYLSGMVVDGLPATALRHLVGESEHPRTAEALVLDRLREALHRLVEHWGMMVPARSPVPARLAARERVPPGRTA